MQTYLSYPTLPFRSKSSGRNRRNGLVAGEGTVWGWWERLEGKGGNGLRGKGGTAWGMGDGGKQQFAHPAKNKLFPHEHEDKTRNT